jgi:alpha/beta superfamily hydrolase
MNRTSRTRSTEHRARARHRRPGRRDRVRHRRAGRRAAARGVAVLCHPHPQHGGTMDNKVVQTLARAFVQLGYTQRCASTSAASAARPAAGTQAAARSTTRWPSSPPSARPACRWCWAASRSAATWPAQAAARLPAAGQPAERLVLIGPGHQLRPCPRWRPTAWSCTASPTTWCRWQSVLDWARPQVLPVTVLPGAGHFFHGQLPCSSNSVIVQALTARPLPFPNPDEPSDAEVAGPAAGLCPPCCLRACAGAAAARGGGQGSTCCSTWPATRCWPSATPTRRPIRPR